MSSNIKSLVIVESPSKIKTLQKFLGSQYTIKASVGHIRDLPKKDLGIDPENAFKTTYVVSPDKKKVITELKAAAKSADEIILATDPDREGEAISWHLLEILNPSVPVKRLVFNELTKTAVLEAFEHTREIDQDLVSAQETRRIMDRLFGFPVSKVLWFNVKGGLSAGRVQSPAIKLIVDREKLRSIFTSNEYWSIDADFVADDGKFSASLQFLQGKKVATGKDFDKSTGQLTAKNAIVLNEEIAVNAADDLQKLTWTVTDIDEKPVTSNPYPPFITSTLQQEGVRKLRMSSRQVMRSAQYLYENGYITYIRTDSVHLSDEAIQAARTQITQLYGEEYLSPKPRIYKSKVKNAQEAHEAIRPAGSSFRTPDELKSAISGKDWQLYDLIWKRSVACQMAAAKLLATTVKISNDDTSFIAKGRVVKFPGYFKAYVKGTESETDMDDREKILPKLALNQTVDCEKITPSSHHTKPTPRFSEATLIKEMEALGIGRPSTYATIMDTIQARGYVNKVKGALIPTFTAYAVVQFLERHFTDLVDLQFTATLEESLDAISRSELDSLEFLNEFYFGEGTHPGLKNLVDQEFDKNMSRSILETMDADGNKVDLKIGRYGLYLQNNGTNATMPDEFVPDELTPEKVSELLQKKTAEPIELGTLEGTSDPILLKVGRFGPYLQVGKKMKSLLPGMTVDEISEEIAQKIMSLPKTIGTYEDNPIVADIGRYGPYIKCGKTNRKVEAPLSVIELTEEDAVQLLASAPKTRATAVLKELGVDEKSGKSIELKSGRYGPYVTDGEVNATMPRGMDADEVDLETAVQMIAEKRARGPMKKRRFKRKK